MFILLQKFHALFAEFFAENFFCLFLFLIRERNDEDAAVVFRSRFKREKEKDVREFSQTQLYLISISSVLFLKGRISLQIILRPSIIPNSSTPRLHVWFIQCILLIIVKFISCTLLIIIVKVYIQSNF